MNAKIHGSKHFTRFQANRPERTVGFDSSPDFTIPKKFGLASPLAYEQVPEETNARYNTWRVFAGEGKTLAGVLREKTQQQIRDELGHG